MWVSTVYSLSEKSWEWANLSPTGKAVKTAKKRMAWGAGHRVSQKKEDCWSSQKRIKYLQMNSATLSRLIKLFTTVVGKAERDTKTFWLSSAASSRSPGNQPFSLTCSPSQKEMGESSCAIPPSCSAIPKHLIALSLMFKIAFPCVASQTLITGHRQIPPHRQGFSSCALLDCKKLQALNKAFPSLRGLNRYLSWVVPQLPSEMRNYAKAFF